MARLDSRQNAAIDDLVVIFYGLLEQWVQAKLDLEQEFGTGNSDIFEKRDDYVKSLAGIINRLEQ